MTRTATTSVADAATDTKLSSTAVDAAAVTPAAPPPTLDDPASRAGSEEPTAASGSSETAHEHYTNDGKPMAKEVTDIEHMKVEDDPRKWSRTKKNVVLLVRFRLPRLSDVC